MGGSTFSLLSVDAVGGPAKGSKRGSIGLPQSAIDLTVFLMRNLMLVSLCILSVALISCETTESGYG